MKDDFNSIAKDEEIEETYEDIELEEIPIELTEYEKALYFGELQELLVDQSKYCIAYSTHNDTLEILGMNDCWQTEREDLYDSEIDDSLQEEIDKAALMFGGKIKLDKNVILQVFEKMYNSEIMHFLSHEDYHNLCNNKEFILDLMEHSGAICEIACYATEDVIKSIFEDKKLLEKIYNNEILNESNLDGEEVLAVLTTQLIRCDGLNSDKEFMENIIKSVVNNTKKTANYRLNGTLNDALIHVLVNKCESMFNDKGFTKNVFDLLEKTDKGSCYENGDLMFKLAAIMLKAPELASNEELAYRYIYNFATCENIDKSLLHKKEFLNRILDELGESTGKFDLPIEFSNDANIVEKYLKSRDVREINLIFNSSTFSNLFEKIYGESMSSYMKSDISELIEKNKSIVISEGDISKYNDAINVLQQWAEDNDLIKIGHKLKIIEVTTGKIVKGQLNIGNGEKGRNTVDYYFVDADCKPTIVLDGNEIGDILKSIGIDNRGDIDAEHELADNTLLNEILDLANKKKSLKQKEISANELLSQYEKLTRKNEKNLNEE